MGKVRFWLPRRSRSRLDLKHEITRDQFREVLDKSFGQDMTMDSSLQYQVLQLVDTAKHIAWGVWLAENSEGLQCGCPVASVSELGPDRYSLSGEQYADPHRADGPACGSGPTTFDIEMALLTGEPQGIAHITD